jgi:site-specific recombinase XerD
LPLWEWLATDQLAYAEAIRPGSILIDGGPASHLAPATLQSLVTAYGRWLGFLIRAGRFDANVPSAQLMTTGNLDSFIEHLRLSMKPISVWSTTDQLSKTLRVMFPTADWLWMRPIINRLRSQAVLRRDLTNRLLSPRKMYRAGIRLMDQAGDARRPIWRATGFRDGLMLALQSARALRRKNLAAISVGATLLRHGDGYMIAVPAAAMKSHRLYEIPIPKTLKPYIDRYLSDIRPQLMQGGTTDALWITQYSKPMSPGGVYRRLTKVTRRQFGRAIPPHMFRAALATSIAIEDPAHVRIAMPLLGHATFATTDRHYIQAQSLRVSRAWSSHLEQLRNRPLAGEDRSPR